MDKQILNIKDLPERELLELILVNQLNIMNTLSYHELLIKHSDQLKNLEIKNESHDTASFLQKSVDILGILNARLKEGIYSKGLTLENDTLVIK